MLILLDLDGTLINTVHPTWKPYKDGQEGYRIDRILDKIPFVNGAKEFIQSRKSKGDHLIVVSDSHHKYVNPICNMIGLDYVALSDKPNIQKLNEYLDSHPEYKDQVVAGDVFFIGDTKFDIETGRKIGAKTIWFLPYSITEEIRNDRDGIGDEMGSLKMGPTYKAVTFQEVESILESPLENLYSLEAVFAGGQSNRSIKLSNNRYKDGSYACIRCLARQEQGACDKYGCGDKYFMTSNPKRTHDFLFTLATGIANYINQDAVKAQCWDYFTYLTDKNTTIPANKMKEIFDLVETNIKKIQLLRWADTVQGSIRNNNLYKDRQQFLQKYLFVDSQSANIVNPSENTTDTKLNLDGKNVIVLDDQLTTSATAWHVIRALKEKGAKNILFIAMFQMILAVNNDVMCPVCGKPMFIKIRRSDGHKFYSCTPPQFRGDGCGYTLDIPNQ